MLVVKIELWPQGDEKHAREIGRTLIHNTGSGTLKRGNYGVRVLRRGNANSVLRTGSVNDYPRLSYNVWRLIIRALKSAFPEEA